MDGSARGRHASGDHRARPRRTARPPVRRPRDAPDLEARAGDAILGDAAPAGTPVEIHWTGLRAGDTLRAITGAGVVETRPCPPGVCARRVTFRPGDARFVRFEALRPLSRGLPALPVLVSNPIYFDA